jgi:hypothetical protein
MKEELEKALEIIRKFVNEFDEEGEVSYNTRDEAEIFLTNQQEQAKEMENEQSLKKIIYDLDELASEYSEGKSTSEVFKRAHESDFKAGFQKAIELLTFKTTEQ